MNIDRLNLTIRDLIDGYEERGDDGIEGVVAYGGKLDVRPAYQREFVYQPKERDEVIRSIKGDFPINVMYWYKLDNDHYELMDGQQRTVSICRYAACKNPEDRKPYEQCFSVDGRYFFNLEEDIQDRILDYNKIDVYVCTGTPSEVHEWFKIINTGSVKLTAQEMLNTSYTGPWLSDAKLFFSKPNCTAYNLASRLLNGSAIRQDYLRTAIKWIADRDNVDDIESYMALHQLDPNASVIKQYFRSVIDWVNRTFINYRPKMKGVDWGILYNRHKDDDLDPAALETKIAQLYLDNEIQNRSGIYEYVLNENEQALNLRAFPDDMKQIQYEAQQGICPECVRLHRQKTHYEFNEMEADHLLPWSRGGRTIQENCRMLCREHNRQIGNR